jgi:ubiquinone biosynthesis monooxygenase Coq7
MISVFVTIEAVETFVDLHYQAQIQSLSPCAHHEAERAVLDLFETCRLDEVAHRDDAAQRRTGKPTASMNLWTTMVGGGSRSAVSLARFL